MTASKTSFAGDVNQLSQASQNKVQMPHGQGDLYSPHLPGPFGPVAMLPYAAIPVDFSGHPMLLAQPQGFNHMGCPGPWASECRGTSPVRRRRPRRGGKGGACFGAANECQELRKNKAKASLGASVSVPAATAVADILDSDPTSVSEDADLSMKILNLLESKDKVKKSSILRWIYPATLKLALSSHGCRIIQKAFDVASGDEKRDLAIKLNGHVRELLESQHGNHVLQKCIEVLPPQAVQFIIDELAFWPMSWVGVAKHRFGCRVIERLLEHCPEDMTAPLTEAVLNDASALARHPYGNYVVQHVLEYGTDVYRKLLVSALVDTGIPFLAQHRIASNVIESALGRVCSADQQTIGLALLSAPQTLLVVGCSRYGTHVVNRLLEVLAPGPLRVEIVRQLLGNLTQIMESKHSKHLVEKLRSVGFD